MLERCAPRAQSWPGKMSEEGVVSQLDALAQ